MFYCVNVLCLTLVDSESIVYECDHVGCNDKSKCKLKYKCFFVLGNELTMQNMGNCCMLLC